MKSLAAGLFLGALLQANSLWACSACYGQSDSPLAKGMNWGIFTLLGFVAFVLGSIATFFVFIGKRSSMVATGEKPQPETTQKT